MTEYQLPCIGIDLGTTYSCVCIWQNDKVEIITNENGNRTTPSYISFDGDERYIGDAAKNQLSNNSENTIFDVKRLIGRPFEDDTIQNDLGFYPFKITKGKGGNSQIHVKWCGKKKTFRPEELSAMILQKLKTDAENFIGEPIKNAVITVPAYFNDAQRQATKDAGVIAGLNVMKILNEPTAAAMAYNLVLEKDSNKNILVYDLGGGTLDVTCLTIDGGVLIAKSTSGDTHLGGEDFDRKLVDYALNEFTKKTFKPKTMLTNDEIKKLLKHCKLTQLQDIYKKNETDINDFADNMEDNKIQKYLKEIANIKSIIVDIAGNTKLVAKLKRACEDTKKVLSTNDTTNITVDSFYFDSNGKCYDLKVNITRDTFEKICDEEFEKCLEPVNKALADAKLKPSDIHDVVLIGGSTRIPKIKQILIEKFGNKLKANINPDEAVAYGATIEAAILCGVSSSSTDMVLCDITPLTLGIETAGGIMQPLIKRNSSIPAKEKRLFSTYKDNQPGVTVKVYEGERSLTKDNNLLGSFQLLGIPPMPRNVPKIEVLFEVDENGIMFISATDQTTKKTNQITIKNDRDRISQQDILKMVEDAEKFAQHDKYVKDSIDAKINFDSYLVATRKSIDDPNFKVIMGDEIYHVLSDRLNECINWLDQNNKVGKNEYDIKRKEIECEFIPIIETYMNKSRQPLNKSTNNDNNIQSEQTYTNSPIGQKTNIFKNLSNFKSESNVDHSEILDNEHNQTSYIEKNIMISDEEISKKSVDKLKKKSRSRSKINQKSKDA